MARQLITPNLDPVIYQGGVALDNWAGWCLAYVQTAFGTGWAGPTAWDSWGRSQFKHEDRSYPRNVYFPVFFSHFGNYGLGYMNYGHVAIAYVRDDGQMQIWSSPASNKPYADVYSSIEAIERTYNSKYVGWAEDLSGQRVIELTATNQVAEGGTVDTIKSMYWRLLGREAPQDDINTYSQVVGTKGWEFVYNDLKNSGEGQADWVRRNPERVANLERGLADRDQTIAELRTALINAQNKPPVEVIKTVEKIVEKPVEVIKEVPVYTHDAQLTKEVLSIKGMLVNFIGWVKTKLGR